VFTPLSLARAAANLRDRVLEGPLADLRRMPRVAVDTGPEEGDAWELGRAHGLARSGSVSTYRYAVHPTARLRGAPVLLVSPLGACGVAFDLRRGCSLVEHLVGEGRHVHQVDDEDLVGHGGAVPASPADLQRWVDEILPHVIRTVSDHHDGAPVHVVGWSIGGLTTLLSATAHTDLPIASLTAFATPFALDLVPLVSPARPLAIAAGGPLLATLQTLLGLLPAPWILGKVGLGHLDELLTTPLTVLANLDDKDFLAQLEAVDDLRALIGDQARHVGASFHEMVDARELASGRVSVGPRSVDLSTLRAPVLLIAGEDDVVVPPRSVRAGTMLLTSADTALTTGPGGHLGVVCGRAARDRTWPRLCAFLDRHDPPAPQAGLESVRGRRRSGRLRPSQRALPRRTERALPPGSDDRTASEQAALPPGPSAEAGTVTGTDTATASTATVDTRAPGHGAPGTAADEAGSASTTSGASPAAPSDPAATDTDPADAADTEATVDEGSAPGPATASGARAPSAARPRRTRRRPPPKRATRTRGKE
jgi:polyhydroxyalkanoate synthase subunit PhaC